MHSHKIDRRSFLAGSAISLSTLGTALSGQEPTLLNQKPRSHQSNNAESLVKTLYEDLSEKQKQEICFFWNHRDPKRGLLRTFIANNWKITSPDINGEFYTDQQRDLIRHIFEALIQPEWHAPFYQQLDDDAGGFGNEQALAIFGKPGSGKFELVLTGRHMTLRCDGDSADHVAFGGPMFYGHAPEFHEGPQHHDNIFWSQALAANELYQMLDGAQRKTALLARTPPEQAIGFQGPKASFPGIPASDLSHDQSAHLQSVLRKLIEPYRQSDQDEVTRCLKTQGGLDACHLAFYSDHDIGKDHVWDNWRLEGPSFVWHFRGAPHVHVWVNVSDSSEVPLNTGSEN